jgi:hypothetical protein
MNIGRLSAGTSRFAHLTGLSRRSRLAEDENQDDNDDPKGKKSRAADDDDGDEDESKGKKSRRAADDDSQDDDDPKGKKSRAADDDDGDEDEPKGKKSRRAADDDDGDEDEPKGKKSRRAAEDDDDDDKEEMSGRSARASARMREQARIAAILGHPSAAHNLPLAVSLACETRMTRREAIAVMRGQTSNVRDDDDDDYVPRNRHARADRASRNPRIGSEQQISGQQAVSSSWDHAFKKAGIKTR